MKPPPLIQDAVAKLCTRFEAGGYALTPVIDIGALVANADGTVDDKELEMLHYLFEALLGSTLDRGMLEHLVRGSLQVILEAGLEPRARFLAEILMDCHAVEEGLLVALGVAFASEGLSEPERSVIDQIAKHARVPASRIDRLGDKVKAAFGAQA
ncbi:MAG TPA: tellurite resistance TerB family protein [Minicystis sp.]|nr:tellurite resistance TerB family protein [Minicystis sp.]